MGGLGSVQFSQSHGIIVERERVAAGMGAEVIALEAGVTGESVGLTSEDGGGSEGLGFGVPP
jgi:hypothetical protein